MAIQSVENRIIEQSIFFKKKSFSIKLRRKQSGKAKKIREQIQDLPFRSRAYESLLPNPVSAINQTMQFNPLLQNNLKAATKKYANLVRTDIEFGRSMINYM